VLCFAGSDVLPTGMTGAVWLVSAPHLAQAQTSPQQSQRKLELGVIQWVGFTDALLKGMCLFFCPGLPGPQHLMEGGTDLPAPLMPSL
jgi:hypothetical protein